MRQRADAAAVLDEAARRLRVASEFQREPFAAMLCGIARRMEMQDCVDYDPADRARVLSCALAILGEEPAGEGLPDS